MRFGKSYKQREAAFLKEWGPEAGWEWRQRENNRWTIHRVDEVFAYFPVKVNESGRHVWLERVREHLAATVVKGREGYHFMSLFDRPEVIYYSAIPLDGEE